VFESEVPGIADLCSTKNGTKCEENSDSDKLKCQKDYCVINQEGNKATLDGVRSGLRACSQHATASRDIPKLSGPEKTIPFAENCSFRRHIQSSSGPTLNSASESVLGKMFQMK
jgi:hypothetical protein